MSAATAKSLRRRLEDVALVELAELNDPVARLLRINSLIDELPRFADRMRRYRARAIQDLRRPPHSLTWEALGVILGVTYQRAQQFAALATRTRKETRP